MVEGVHWDARLSPADVGFKLVAVNVSDVAAMGGRPEWAMLSLSLPPADEAWIDGFAAGLGEALARWDLALVGGDTTRGRVRTASLSVGGRASPPVLRSGARVGDRVWVAGPLGLAAEAMLSPAPRPEALAWLRRPLPDPAFAQAIAPHVSAMMDVSDGLRTDLRRLCTASGVGAAIESARLPGEGPLAWRVAYGDDYALLFTAPEHPALHAAAAAHGCHLARIGEVTPAEVLLDGGPWPAPAFSHFVPARPPEP